jgi:hypothetical protein
VKSCCGGDAFNGSVDPITSNLYVNGETDELPSAAVLASLGCGNPTVLAELYAGDVVLDLGSGGGIDVILSTRRHGRSIDARGARACGNACRCASGGCHRQRGHSWPPCDVCEGIAHGGCRDGVARRPTPVPRGDRAR